MQFFVIGGTQMAFQGITSNFVAWPWTWPCDFDLDLSRSQGQMKKFNPPMTPETHWITHIRPYTSYTNHNQKLEEKKNEKKTKQKPTQVENNLFRKHSFWNTTTVVSCHLSVSESVRIPSVPDIVYAIFPIVFHQWLSNLQIWWPWRKPWID